MLATILFPVEISPPEMAFSGIQNSGISGISSKKNLTGNIPKSRGIEFLSFKFLKFQKNPVTSDYRVVDNNNWPSITPITPFFWDLL